MHITKLWWRKLTLHSKQQIKMLFKFVFVITRLICKVILLLCVILGPPCFSLSSVHFLIMPSRMDLLCIRKLLKIFKNVSFRKWLHTCSVHVTDFTLLLSNHINSNSLLDAIQNVQPTYHWRFVLLNAGSDIDEIIYIKHKLWNALNTLCRPIFCYNFETDWVGVVYVLKGPTRR